MNLRELAQSVEPCGPGEFEGTPSQNGAADSSGPEVFGAAGSTAQPIDGASLLDEVAAHIRQYVVLKPLQVDVVVLWIAHAHAIEAFYTTGRLFVRSPEPECGKSLLFDVMESLVPADPILDVSISPAALYRSLDEERPPVVMLDEIDKTIGRNGAADSESLALLLAVVNGGYRRGRFVRRCVGSDHKVVKFPTFSPVAFAGISPRLDRAALTRSIPIDMQRRAPDEEVQEHVAWDAVPAGEEIRDRLAAWASQHIGALRQARPDRPPSITNRLAETWVPLFAVADAAGRDWPERARAAALNLTSTGREDTDVGFGTRLLGDVRTAFGEAEACWTATLIDYLNGLEEAPWSRWNDGAGIKPHDLANRIKPFGIHRSADIKIDGTTRKGYRQAWFEEAWTRYLPRREESGDEVADSGLPGSASEPLPRYSPTAAKASGSDEDETLDLLEPGAPLEDKGSRQVADKDGYLGAADPLPGSETTLTRDQYERWSADQIAGLDTGDPDHGVKVAEIRAQEVLLWRGGVPLDGPDAASLNGEPGQDAELETWVPSESTPDRSDDLLHSLDDEARAHSSDPGRFTR